MAQTYDFKERLEDIKEDINNNTVKEYEFMTTILYEDALWLVKHVEETLDYHKEISGLNDIIISLKKENGHFKDKVNSLDDKVLNLTIKNRQYSEYVKELINYIETTNDDLDQQVHKIHVILDRLNSERQ